MTTEEQSKIKQQCTLLEYGLGIGQDRMCKTTHDIICTVHTNLYDMVDGAEVGEDD